jgi:hypothetical protein
MEKQEIRKSCIAISIAVVVKTELFWAVTLQLIADQIW